MSVHIANEESKSWRGRVSRQAISRMIDERLARDSSLPVLI